MSGRVVEVAPFSSGGREFCSNIWTVHRSGSGDFVIGVSPTVQGQFTGSLRSLNLNWDFFSDPDPTCRVSFSLRVVRLADSTQVGESLYYAEFPMNTSLKPVNISMDLLVPFVVPVGCVLMGKGSVVGDDNKDFLFSGNFRWVSSDIVLQV